MKRDLSLIRMLVFAVEDLPSEDVEDQIRINGYSEQEVGYHSYLLVDAGLAAGVDVKSIDGNLPNWRLFHLTSAGHDFADAARSDTTWNKASDIVSRNAGTVSLDLMKQLLVAIIKGTLGL